MTHTFSLAALAASITLSAVTASAQRTWVVDDDGGPGVDFTAIQPAIDAAAAGDVVRIRAGTYAAFELRRPLSLLGEAGVEVADRGLLHIADLPSNSVTTIADISFLRVFDRTAFVSQCAGTLLFERVNFGTNQQQDMLLFFRAFDLRLNACQLSGATVFESCYAVASDSIMSSFQLVLGPPPTVGVSSSVLELSRCQVVGSPQFSRGGYGSALAISAQSTVRLSGDGSSTVAAGSGTGRALPAVIGSGTLIRDPRVVVQGSNGGPPVSGPTDIVRALPSLSALGAPIGGTIEVDLLGRQGQLYALVVGLPAAPLALPQFGGSLGISPATLPVVAQGVFDASERLHLSLPAGPAPLGLALSWQAVAGDSAGLQLSNSATYVRVP